MLLVIDIGNTNITFGLYQGDKLGPSWRIRTILDRMPDEYGILLDQLFRHRGLGPQDVHGIALASVVPPLTPVFGQVCKEYVGLEPLVVDAGVKTGVRVRYDHPRQVGADRVVDAAAVRVLYSTPACVVDFGTATTFDALSAEGDYLGGAIAPGIGIAAQALFEKTAKLPRVELVRPPSVIGRNTPHSIQSGLLYGYVGLVEGMVARFRDELGPKMKVIATGGLAPLIAVETKVIDVVDPWLTLAGLRIIWDMNQEKES
ncbi:MAG: type III pantothenate kinase [Anaerolineales bacterium]|nr:type III pantothenate kinase [Anaerolineales bacterium]